MNAQNRASAAGTLVVDKCPNCGAPLPLPGPDGASVCTYCGTTFRPAAPTPPPPPLISAAPSLPSWYRPYAGGAVPPHAVYSAPARRKSWPGIIFFVIFLLVFILPGILSMMSMSSTPSTPQPPTITSPPTLEIQASVYNGPAPLTVYFSAVVSGGSAPYQPVSWNFGDGNLTTDNAPVHVFTYAGQFTVYASVVDNNGNTGYNQLTINVT